MTEQLDSQTKEQMMAFPLATVLTAAPGLISAATDIMRMIRERKKHQDEPQPEIEKIKELMSLIEQQANVIEELAINNRNMAMAVRNNRIIAIASFGAAMLAIIISIVTS